MKEIGAWGSDCCDAICSIEEDNEFLSLDTQFKAIEKQFKTSSARRVLECGKHPVKIQNATYTSILKRDKELEQ